MSSVVTNAHLSTFRRISWPRPEWWSLGLCLGAWLMIMWKAVAGSASHGHVHHEVAGPNPEPLLIQNFWWLVMVVAMMFPLLTAHIRNTAARSLWVRRHRAIGAFLVGYVAPWILFGLAAVGILFVLEIPRTASGLIGVSAALIWQVMPPRRRFVLACHRTQPIAPVGLRADFDCVRYGWMVGNNCVLSCWALMLACLLFGHSIVAMIGLTAIGLIERSTPRPKRLVAISVIAGLGMLHLIW